MYARKYDLTDRCNVQVDTYAYTRIYVYVMRDVMRKKLAIRFHAGHCISHECKKKKKNPHTTQRVYNYAIRPFRDDATPSYFLLFQKSHATRFSVGGWLVRDSTCYVYVGRLHCTHTCRNRKSLRRGRGAFEKNT